MSQSQTFEQWFEGEKENGLVDIKLSLSSNGASSREAKDEIRLIELQIENGFVESMPPAQSQLVSPVADEIICRHVAKF